MEEESVRPLQLKPELLVRFKANERGPGVVGKALGRSDNKDKICFIKKGWEITQPKPGEVWLCILDNETHVEGKRNGGARFVIPIKQLFEEVSCEAGVTVNRVFGCGLPTVTCTYRIGSVQLVHKTQARVISRPTDIEPKWPDDIRLKVTSMLSARQAAEDRLRCEITWTEERFPTENIQGTKGTVALSNGVSASWKTWVVLTEVGLLRHGVISLKEEPGELATISVPSVLVSDAVRSHNGRINTLEQMQQLCDRYGEPMEWSASFSATEGQAAKGYADWGNCKLLLDVPALFAQEGHKPQFQETGREQDCVSGFVTFTGFSFKMPVWGPKDKIQQIMSQ